MFKATPRKATFCFITGTRTSVSQQHSIGDDTDVPLSYQKQEVKIYSASIQVHRTLGNNPNPLHG